MPPKKSAGGYRPPIKSAAKASSSKLPDDGRPSASKTRRPTDNKGKGKAAASTSKPPVSAARYLSDEASEEDDEEEDEDDEEALSLVDPEEELEEYSDQEEDSFGSDDDGDDFKATGGPGGNKKRKGAAMPSARVQQKKWRKLSVEEREAVTSEGGIVWREARALIAGLPKSAQQLVSSALFKALARADQQLEKTLVPREPRMPAVLGVGAGGRAMASASAGTASTAAAGGVGAEVTSSMISWRVEELGELNNGGLGALNEDEGSGAGFGGDIADLEAMLLPEAEQAVGLSRQLDEQDAALSKSRARLARLRREAGAGDATVEKVKGRADIGKLVSLLKRVRDLHRQSEDDAPSADV